MNSEYRDINNSLRALVPFIIVINAVLLIAVFHRYIFLEENLPFLFITIFLFTIFYSRKSIPKALIVNYISFMAIVFVIYMGIRMYDFFPSSIITIINKRNSGLIDIINQLFYYGLFGLSALLYYRKGKISYTLWLLIGFYLVAYIFRNSILFGETLTTQREGAHLGHGFVMITFIPFLFLRSSSRFSTLISNHFVFLLSITLLFLVGARTALVSCLLFYLFMILWPLFTRSKRFYYSVFWIVSFSIAVVVALYLVVSLGGGMNGVEEISENLFQKSIGTRVGIWSSLLGYIVQQPIWGYGTESSSTYIAAPSWFWEAKLYRETINSHSLYFELLLRFGVVGLILFLLLLFSIWRALWPGRREQAVRVAGSFLLAALFFAASQEFLMFNMQLRNGIAWVILGLGVGASLRTKKNKYIQQNEVPPLAPSKTKTAYAINMQVKRLVDTP